MSAPSIVCGQCLARSFNRHDITEGYCGRCHEYTAGEVLCEHGEVMDEDYVPGQIHAHLRELGGGEVEFQTYWWHVWRTTTESGTLLTITLGPTRLGPDDEADNGKGTVREQTFPMALFNPEEAETKPGPEATYLASFTYDPGDEVVIPEDEEGP